MGTKSRIENSANQEVQLLQQAVEFVTAKSDDARPENRPATGIILGSGLGGLADQIHDPVVLSYEDIPGFGSSAAVGHRGELILGTIEASPVIAMAGRFHRYEGWSNEQVAFPVKLMAQLGAKRLIVSNAAGGVNPKFRVGDIVVIRDHLNFMGRSNFRGSEGLRSSGLPAEQKSSELGMPPDQPQELDAEYLGLMRGGETYDPELSRIAFQVGVREGFNVYSGTYLATLGPNYETRSEYRMMRRIGADVAGMSTVPEVLAGCAAGMRILGLSMVSNVANPDQPTKADHSEVLEAGIAAAAKLESIVREVLSS
ncbi:MAG TPA: purine-nucleoside phosphorylase [Rhodopirellula sp.]|nr:MAG: purine-nucleoside phosphorylase [Saprospirales bacterium TMED214]HBV66338.1 purine-nucleoside phosphorylase [Rhodopirellula sp.]